jgi:hypothetical protein
MTTETSKENLFDSKTDSHNKNNENITNSVWKTGYINGNTFRNKEVKYKLVNGMAIFEGDIILASSPEEIEKLNQTPIVQNEHELSVKPLLKAVIRKGDKLRWPLGEIPYTIQSSLPNQQRVLAAIQHWEERTPIRFILRDDNNSKYYPNYVSFVQYVSNAGGTEEVFHCSSAIGMQRWGQQNIVLSDQCGTGDVIHEIGHTVGLWHEQSREDRDSFVKINWDNIEDGIQLDGSYDSTKDSRHNFGQHIVDGDDVGDYDYCSIMHYGMYFFSKQGNPTIEPQYPNNNCANSLGQKEKLSDGDIDAVVEMYANLTPTVIKNKDGRLEAFIIGKDKRIHHKFQKAVNSTDWDEDWVKINLDQEFLASGQRPAISKDSNDRLYVIWLKDNVRYYAYKDKSSDKWSSIQNATELDQVDFEGDPVVTQNVQGNLEVFIVHEDMFSKSFRLHHFIVDGAMLPSLGGRWSPNARPILEMTNDGTLVAFLIGQDRQLYFRYQLSMLNNREWSDDWIRLGGPSETDPPEYRFSDPAIAIDNEGRLNVFFIDSKYGTLQHYYKKTRDVEKSEWIQGMNLEGNWHSRRRIAVARNQDNRLEVFIVGTDGRLYHRWQTIKNNDGSWQWFMNWVPFEKHTWPQYSNPLIVQNQDGRLEVFMIGSDGRLYHKWQTTPSNSNQWSLKWLPI